MRTLPGTLLVAALVVAVTGLVTDQGWPGYLVGAINALALWVICYFSQVGAARSDDRGLVPLVDYAIAAAAALALGAAIFLLAGDGDNASFWSVGTILGGLLSGVGRREGSSSA